MYVRLRDPLLVGELISFLSRCNCSAVQVSHDVVKVEVDHDRRSRAGLRLVRTGRCIECGGTVERVLAEVGSLKCHDCRDGNGGSHESRTRPTGDVQLDGYLHVWSALHPGAIATPLSDVGGRAGISRS